jgi:guanine nucleotide-binding protein subunit beta-2-like 1 protein
LIAAATENEIRVWAMSDDVKNRDALEKLENVVDVTGNGKSTKRRFGCTSIAFSTNAEKLYGGFTDGTIIVWEIKKND